MRTLLSLAFISIVAFSCTGNKPVNDKADADIDKYCKMVHDYYDATDHGNGEEALKIDTAAKKFYDAVEEKFKDDTASWHAFERGAKACNDAHFKK